MMVGRIIKLAIVGALLGGMGYWVYSSFFKKPEPQLYSAKHPEKRTIRQVIKATGALEAEDFMKIGSLVNGVILEMRAEENDTVKKGQVLAVIDDGKEDTEVRETLSLLQTAQVNLTYQSDHFKRQEALHDAQFISDDDFEKATLDYERAQNEVMFRQALYDRAVLIFNHKKILAPDDGVVVGKQSREGEAVTTFAPPTVLYTIARDLRKMKAKIEIDESYVGVIRKKMPVLLTYDTYLDQTFKSVISELSNNPLEKGGTVSYQATLEIDNEKMLFRPGMTVNAEIVVAEAKNVVSISGQQFAINPLIVEQVAKVKKYGYKPLTVGVRTSCQKRGICKTLWVERDKTFVEVPVKIGITDGAYFEIVEGVTEKDLVIYDTIEENAMAKLFKKFFSAGLQ